ncbi:hypothetical protein ACUH91_07390 [Dermabacteraceae bacterium P9123]
MITLIGQIVSERPKELNAATVSPGLAGFIAVFLVALVTVALIMDMSRRVRRAQALGDAEQRHAEAAAEQAQEEAGQEETAGEETGQEEA